MNPSLDPTPEQMERAFAQMRVADWPWSSAEELRAAKAAIDRAFLCVRGRAVSMANGQVMPPAPVRPTTTATHAKPPQTPALGYLRRRDDGPAAFDPKLAASGEYAHHDDNE